MTNITIHSGKTFLINEDPVVIRSLMTDSGKQGWLDLVKTDIRAPSVMIKIDQISVVDDVLMKKWSAPVLENGVFSDWVKA